MVWQTLDENGKEPGVVPSGIDKETEGQRSVAHWPASSGKPGPGHRFLDLLPAQSPLMLLL